MRRGGNAGHRIENAFVDHSEDAYRYMFRQAINPADFGLLVRKMYERLYKLLSIPAEDNLRMSGADAKFLELVFRYGMADPPKAQEQRTKNTIAEMLEMVREEAQMLELSAPVEEAETVG